VVPPSTRKNREEDHSLQGSRKGDGGGKGVKHLFGRRGVKRGEPILKKTGKEDNRRERRIKSYTSIIP